MSYVSVEGRDDDSLQFVKEEAEGTEKTKKNG